MNPSPKISVVTVTYNSAATLEETMLSVLNQTYSDVEYIIIDGGSTDGTVDIIKKYADRLAYWVSEPDKGIYDAMNKGVAIATGDYINFLNSGDIFYSDTTLLDVLTNKEFENADVIYGDIILVYNRFEVYSTPAPLEKFPQFDPISHPSSLTKLYALKKRPFDISYRIAGDYEFFYWMYIHGMKFHYIPLPITKYDAENGVSANNVSKRIDEEYRVNGKKKTIMYGFKKNMAITTAVFRRALSRYFPWVVEKIKIRKFSNDPNFSIIMKKN